MQIGAVGDAEARGRMKRIASQRTFVRDDGARVIAHEFGQTSFEVETIRLRERRVGEQRFDLAAALGGEQRVQLGGGSGGVGALAGSLELVSGRGGVAEFQLRGAADEGPQRSLVFGEFQHLAVAALHPRGERR